MTLALIQHPCTADIEYNLSLTIKGIKEAAANGAQLVLLQELHASLYFCQQEDTRHFDLAEAIEGTNTGTLKSLSQLAKELKIVIVSSLFEKRAAGLYHNTAVVLEHDGRIAGQYRKMHIPDDPGFYEKFYFTPGDIGFHPIETSVGKLGLLVCWDQWFPEAARLMALAGADILLFPTAIGWDDNDSPEEKARQVDAWQLVQRGHAIANGLPLAACNRCGIEQSDDGKSSINFWGNSFISGPQGEILAQAPVDETSVLITKIDMSRSEEVRRIWPFLRDRRIDAYEDLLLRYRDQLD
ncbi:MAG: carbon-nitrogen hydrolase [Gammaproteobacteria bacterium]|nr:carbon-nitrogen hydrolase [Gammaproteobacteria bacterium]